MYIKNGSEKLSRLQRCLGIIEGVALALSDEAKQRLFEAVEEIDSVINDLEPDNK